MGLQVIRTPDVDLSRVQQNVKAECDRIDARIPTQRTPSIKTTSDYTVQLTDSLVLCGPAMPSTLNITLPFSAPCRGLTFTVKNISAAGLVNMRGAYVGGVRELIDGIMPYPLAAGAKAACFSDGVAWWVV